MGRPSVDSEQLNLRLQRDLLNGIDRFSAGQPDEPSRTEAVRRLLRDELNRLGYLNDAVGIIGHLKRPSGLEDDEGDGMQDLLGKIDEAIIDLAEDRPPALTRPQMIREMVAYFLRQHGYLPK